MTEEQRKAFAWEYVKRYVTERHPNFATYTPGLVKLTVTAAMDNLLRDLEEAAVQLERKP